MGIDRTTNFDITRTKFFPIVLKEIFSTNEHTEIVSTPVQASPDIVLSESPEQYWQSRSEDEDYLYKLLGELEKRKAMAILCITPEKLHKMSAGGLSHFIKDANELIIETKAQLRRIKSDRKLFNKQHNNLSGDDRQRLDNLIENA